MSKVRIYIPTTEGPVQVERITREPAAQSAVCVKRSTRVLAISGDYDSFVRAPSGVIEREFGPFDPGAFRLDVSAPIEDGESWQLGVFVAHALSAQGRLAGPEDEADTALWLSGALDNDLSVREVAHIPEKLQLSQTLRADLADEGIELAAFVPDANAEAAAHSAGAISVSAIATATEALAAAGLKSAPAPAPKETPAPAKTPPASRMRWIWIVALGAFAAVAIVQNTDQPEPTPPPKTVAQAPAAEPAQPAPKPQPKPKAEPEKPEKPEKPAEPIAKPAPEPKQEPKQEPKPKPEPKAKILPPAIMVTELRAPAGGHCAAVQFGNVKAVESPVEETGKEVLADSRLEGLCGLSFTIRGLSPAGFARATVTAKGGRLLKTSGLPKELSGRVRFSEPLTWRVHLPKRLDRPLSYVISLTTAKEAINSTAKPNLIRRHRIVP